MGKGKHEIRPSEHLFADDQRDLFEKSYEERLREEKSKAVECLGMTFPNDEERRNHFLGILREKLKDSEFRKIEGFPIGSDEDILALSDPPYYTACPNPFIADFIKHYGKPYDPSTPYSREPFAADDWGRRKSYVLLSCSTDLYVVIHMIVTEGKTHSKSRTLIPVLRLAILFKL